MYFCYLSIGECGDPGVSRRGIMHLVSLLGSLVCSCTDILFIWCIVQARERGEHLVPFHATCPVKLMDLVSYRWSISTSRGFVTKYTTRQIDIELILYTQRSLTVSPISRSGRSYFTVALNYRSAKMALLSPGTFSVSRLGLETSVHVSALRPARPLSCEVGLGFWDGWCRWKTHRNSCYVAVNVSSTWPGW